MSSDARAFRNAAAQACGRDRAALRGFYEGGLEDILDEAEANGWDFREIAAQVLAWCCVEGGRFAPRHMIRFRAVIGYLNHLYGPLKQGEQQAWTDLVSILNEGGSLAAVRTWVRTHYV
jgi:hypothetical protein